MNTYLYNEDCIYPVYVCDVQKIESMTKTLLMNNFPHHQFILCTSGKGLVCSESDVEIVFESGMVLFTEAAALFSVRADSEDFSIKRIAFNGDFASNYLQYFGFGIVSIIKPNGNEICLCINKIISLFEKGDLKNSSVYLYELIGLCGETTLKNAEIHSTIECLAIDGFNYIKTNIWRSELDIKEFAAQRNITIEEMDEIFAKYFSNGSSGLIYAYRMEFAKHAVFLSGNANYHKYYSQCGFNSPDEFAEEFVKYTGMSVTDYLNSSWDKNLL